MASPDYGIETQFSSFFRKLSLRRVGTPFQDHCGDIVPPLESVYFQKFFFRIFFSEHFSIKKYSSRYKILGQILAKSQGRYLVTKKKFKNCGFFFGSEKKILKKNFWKYAWKMVQMVSPPWSWKGVPTLLNTKTSPSTSIARLEKLERQHYKMEF